MESDMPSASGRKTTREKVGARRARLRAQGLRLFFVMAWRATLGARVVPAIHVFLVVRS
jgi:hypothetical protein